MASWKYETDGFTEVSGGFREQVRCYESHPVLKMGKGTLCGGSASYPVGKGADIYVSLQSGSTSGKISDPWEEKRKVVEIQFSVQDSHAPTNVPRFKKMVTWLCNQLQQGKTVHVGCIGGHGRTGTVLSAIVAESMGVVDAIQWVRKHYCKKAVESTEQVEFLVKHYGVSDTKPSRGGYSTYSPAKPKPSLLEKAYAGDYSGDYYPRSKDEDTFKPVKTPVVKAKATSSETERIRTFLPMSSSRSLWKAKRKKA